MSLGYIDGDTETDVLVSSQGTSQDIYWFENDGSENFASNPHSIDTSFSAQYNTLADINDDGDLDAMVASYYGYKVSWYANDGAGNFGSENILPGSGITDFEGANHPHVGDLDNDGADIFFIPQICIFVIINKCLISKSN
jgi:hypothetical protein